MKLLTHIYSIRCLLVTTYLLYKYLKYLALLPLSLLYFGHHLRIKKKILWILLSATRANKMTPLHDGTSYTHDFRFYSKGNVSASHKIAWAGSLNPQIVWAVRGLYPLLNPPNMGHTHLNFPPNSYLGQGQPKNHQHFY